MKTGAILPAGPDPAEFAPGTATRPDVIYFFGDSITLGWRDESLGGWPVRLLRGLHAEGHAATGYNLGIRGDTSTRIADRWEDEVRRRRRDGHALLVFAFGVNDATLEPDGKRSLPVEQTVRNVRHILDQARSHPVLLIGPAPINEALMHERLNATGDAPMPTSKSIAEVARRMAAEAKAAGVPFLDLLESFRDDPAWNESLVQTDGLHPSSAGHDLIADEIRRWAAWRRLFPPRP